MRRVGDIETSGDVEISGYLEGNVRCRNLVVSETGYLQGSANGERITVRGKVDGELCGARVALEKKAQVNASISYTNLAMDSSVSFSGTQKKIVSDRQD
jgi:cytoskeletal protein CcmA (bactofilin family)